MPCSAMLLLEPTVAYRRVPSGLAIRFLVQWWLSVPPGSGATCTPGAEIDVAPGEYGKRTTASVLAT